LIKKLKKKTIEQIFKLFNQSINNKDEYAAHYIGKYLREMMMNTIDHYITSLVVFRCQSIVSMENFKKFIHQYLVNSIRESIQNRMANNQLANKSLNYFQSKTLDYDQQINIYKIVQIFSERNNLIPIEVIYSIRS
jgi:hypothetical protein